jgi:hypothetical protein
MLRKGVALLATVAVATATVLACDFYPVEPTVGVLPASCQAISDSCVGIEQDAGAIHDCNVFATTQTDEAECAKRKTACVKACNEVTGNTGGEGSSGENGSGGGEGSGEPAGPNCVAILDHCLYPDPDSGPVHECVLVSQRTEAECTTKKEACVTKCDRASAGHLAEPSCEAIIDRCHDLDVADGPIHDCHVFAETKGKTEAECAARKSQCLATCVPDDGGGGQ